jgi:hypothetical protein
MAEPTPNSGASASAYFTEQLLTILVAGLFGFVAVQMYRNGMLEKLLAPQFHTWVLGGGIAILLLVVIRAFAVWREAGEFQKLVNDPNYPEGHVHTFDCGHPHFRANDPDAVVDQGHNHDLSWVFARMLILIFPIALFFLGLPNASYSKERQLALVGNDSALGEEMLESLAKDAAIVAEKTLENGDIQTTLKSKTGLMIRETTPAGGGKPIRELIGGEGRRMSFNDLNDAAFDEAKRESLQGQTAILEGRFKRLADKEFSLFRLKMTCCAADTVPLKVRIVVPQALSGYTDFDWVQVSGQIQFLKAPGQDRYIPVVMVADITNVKKTEPKNEYEQ